MYFSQNHNRIPLLQRQAQIPPSSISCINYFYLILSFLITNLTTIFYFICINKYYSIGYFVLEDLDLHIFLFSYLCVLILRGIVHPIQSFNPTTKRSKFTFLFSIICPFIKYANVVPQDRAIIVKAYKIDVIVITLELISGIGAMLKYTFFCYKITECINQLKWFFVFSILAIVGGMFQLLILTKLWNSLMKFQKSEIQLLAQRKAYIYKTAQITNHQSLRFNQKYKKPSIMFSLVGYIGFLAIPCFCYFLYSYCHYYYDFKSFNDRYLIYVMRQLFIFIGISIMLLKLLIIPILSLGCSCSTQIKIFILLTVLFPQLKYYKTAQKNIYFNQTFKIIFKADIFCLILQFWAFVFAMIATQIIYFSYNDWTVPINTPTIFTYVMAGLFIISTFAEAIYYYYYRQYFEWALNKQNQNQLYISGKVFSTKLKNLMNETDSYEILKQGLERLPIKVPIQIKTTSKELNKIFILLSCLINIAACILYFVCIYQYYDFMRYWENIFAYLFLFCYIAVIIIRGFIQIVEGLVSEDSLIHFKFSSLVSLLCPCLKYLQDNNFNYRKILRKTYKLDIIATILLILSGLTAFIGYILFYIAYNPYFPRDFFYFEWWIIFSILTVLGGIYQLLLLIDIGLILKDSISSQLQLKGVQQAYIYKMVSKLNVDRLQQIQQYPNKLKCHAVFRYIGLIGFVIFPLYFYIMNCYRNYTIYSTYVNVLAYFLYQILLFSVLVSLLLKMIIIPIYGISLNPTKSLNFSILLTIFCPQYKYFTIAEKNIHFNKHFQNLLKFDMACVILNIWIFALAIFCGFNYSYYKLVSPYDQYLLPKNINYVIGGLSLLSSIFQGIFYYNYTSLYCLGMKRGKFQKMMKQGEYLKDALDKIQEEEIKKNEDINYSQASKTRT